MPGLRMDCIWDGGVEQEMWKTCDYCLDNLKYVCGANSNELCFPDK